MQFNDPLRWTSMFNSNVSSYVLVEERSGVADARVVHEDIYRSETLRDRLHHRFDFGFVRYVRANADALDAQVTNLVGGFLGDIRVHVVDDDVGTVGCKSLRRLFTHTAARAGDERGPLGQVTVHVGSVRVEPYICFVCLRRNSGFDWL